MRCWLANCFSNVVIHWPKHWFQTMVWLRILGIDLLSISYVFSVMASVLDEGKAQPFYSRVCVYIKDAPKSCTWKAWLNADGTLTWAVWDILPCLLPERNLQSNTFRVNKMFEDEFAPWSVALNAEGKELKDIYLPSWKSLKQRGAHDGAALTHECASLTTDGVLSLFAWFACNRSQTKDKVAGACCLHGFLVNRAPALADEDVEANILFECCKAQCNKDATDGMCLHVRELRESWKSGVPYRDNVCTLLLGALGHRRYCNAAMMMSALLIAKLDVAIHTHWNS